jgi:hypothetical protein
MAGVAGYYSDSPQEQERQTICRYCDFSFEYFFAGFSDRWPLGYNYLSKTLNQVKRGRERLPNDPERCPIVAQANALTSAAANPPAILIVMSQNQDEMVQMA